MMKKIKIINNSYTSTLLHISSPSKSPNTIIANYQKNSIKKFKKFLMPKLPTNNIL